MVSSKTGVIGQQYLYACGSQAQPRLRTMSSWRNMLNCRAKTSYHLTWRRNPGVSWRLHIMTRYNKTKHSGNSTMTTTENRCHGLNPKCPPQALDLNAPPPLVVPFERFCSLRLPRHSWTKWTPGGGGGASMGNSLLPVCHHVSSSPLPHAAAMMLCSSTWGPPHNVYCTLWSHRPKYISSHVIFIEHFGHHDDDTWVTNASMWQSWRHGALNYTPVCVCISGAQVQTWAVPRIPL